MRNRPTRRDRERAERRVKRDTAVPLLCEWESDEAGDYLTVWHCEPPEGA